MAFELTHGNFTDIITTTPEFLQIPFFIDVLHDAYLVIFNSDKFKPVIPKSNGIQGIYANYSLTTEELITVNNLLKNADKMLDRANISPQAIGTNNCSLFLEHALNTIYTQIQKERNKIYKDKAKRKKEMSPSNIRRSFYNKIGSMPEPIFAAMILYLVYILHDYIKESNTLECMAITTSITRLSFFISQNRRAIVGGNKSVDNMRWNRLLNSNFGITGDHEIDIRDICEITGLDYNQEKEAEKLLKRWKNES